ncbi:MAG TPA: PQQ-binding-like beta-propeller repeat protein [Acidobacteriota bacterium]|nr:PQQ-binding-like beta-propeller repeat protein [Acidobacteriota bacterium]
MWTLAFLLGAAADAPLGAQDWPAWRGPASNGSVQSARDGQPGRYAAGDPSQGRLALRVAWKREVGSGYSGLVAAQGRLVTMASQAGTDYVVCLDADSGQVQWRYPLGPAFPGVDGAQDGPTSTPLIDEGRVYALAPRGLLAALDLETGEEIWSQLLVRAHNAVRPKWGFTTSPIAQGQRLIVLTGGRENNAITAFDKRGGGVLWTSGNDVIDYQSPVALKLSGRRQIVYASNSAVYGLDPVDGSQLWSFVHQGAQFYRRIINPLQVGPDTILIKHQRQASMLLRVTGPDDRESPSSAGTGWTAEKVWETPHLKLNYNIPVVHEGYVFGHNGRFLNCIDVEDGSRVWRSRPPGDGFLILVDDHLAVLTKAGSLHLAAATSEGYREEASLQVFDLLSWTPPIYAQGRFFARDSFSQVAAVEVVPASEPPAMASDAPSQSRFAEFIEGLEKAAPERRSELIEDFLDRHPTSPVLEGKERAHFIYYGPAQDLALQGDMVDAVEQLSMRRVPGTDFFYVSFEFDPAARLTYQFIKDFDETLVDPRNPLKGPSLFGGEVSIVEMPDYRPPESSDDGAADTPWGRLESWDYSSPFWRTSRKVSVLLPPGYEDGNQRYPVVFFHYGQALLQQVALQERLEALWAGTLPPFIAVFAQAISPREYARSERDEYVRMMAEGLVPEIDSRYRTRPWRALAGMLEGAYGALYTAFQRPDLFNAAAALSPRAIGDGDQQLLQLADSVQPRPRLYLSWGTYDFRYSSRQEDVAAFSRRLASRLRQGSSHGLKEVERPEGSGLPIWLPRLEEALFFLLAEDREQ